MGRGSPMPATDIVGTRRRATADRGAVQTVKEPSRLLSLTRLRTQTGAGPRAGLCGQRDGAIPGG